MVQVYARSESSAHFSSPAGDGRSHLLTAPLNDPSHGGSTSRLVVLAPRAASVPSTLQNVEASPLLRGKLLAETQRFRGRIYFADGAIQRDDLSSDGRHTSPVDDSSWHVISVQEDGTITACFRFIEEGATAPFDSLWISHSMLAKDGKWGQKLRRAVLTEMESAARQRMAFGEVGGWAVAPERRWTCEAVRTVMAAYALLQLLGGSICVATATFRHNSAGVLQRMGLSPLSCNGDELPPYYDPAYGCDMQALRFDSRAPNPRYRSWCLELQSHLQNARVIADQARPPFQPWEQPHEDRSACASAAGR